MIIHGIRSGGGVCVYIFFSCDFVCERVTARDGRESDGRGERVLVADAEERD